MRVTSTLGGQPHGRRLPTLVLIGLALLALPATRGHDEPLPPPDGDPATPGFVLGIVEAHHQQ